MGAVPNWVVVPCFNEAARLHSTAFLEFSRSNDDTALLFVDDASTDGTAHDLGVLAERSEGRIEVIRLPVNVGKAEAVRAGLVHVLERDPELVGYIDADLATPLAELERLIATAQTSGASAVLGSRVAMLGHDIRRTARRHYLGRVFATAASQILGIEVYDTQCGAKVFRADAALRQAVSVPFRSRWVFDVELLQRLIAAEPTARLIEVPLNRWSDVDGSKLSFGAMAGAVRDLWVLGSQRRAGPGPGERRTRRNRL